jgi:hypothetical protein
MEPKRAESHESLTDTIRHLRDVTTNSRINNTEITRYGADPLRLRTEQMDGAEKAIFPLVVLPSLQADNFTGRQKDLDSIHEWLGLQQKPLIRTYTIYGRRGIGKTQASNSSILL